MVIINSNKIRKKDHDGVITLEEFLDNYETVLSSHISDNGQLFHDELWANFENNTNFLENSLDKIQTYLKKLFWTNKDIFDLYLLRFLAWEF